MSAHFYVYEHWRPDTNQCFYVGKGTGYRSQQFKKRNPHHNAIRAKLERLGLFVEIKIFVDGLTEVEAFSAERARIAFWRAANVRLTNRSDGGEGLSNPPQETREKIAAAFRGKPLAEETKRKISRALVGRLSAERKQYVIDNPAERQRLASIRLGIPSYNKGLKMPEEQRAKLREAWKTRRLRPVSDEIREKGRQAAYRRWRSAPESPQLELSVVLR